MRIYGSFLNEKKRTVGVEISIPSASGDDVEITADGMLQFAGDDTVVTESGGNDSTDVVRQHSATIALQADRYVEALFSREYKDAAVEVSLDGDCVFSGWLEPRVMSMPFNERYDDLTLSCVDCLSALQYSPYRDIKDNDGYLSVKGASATPTFMELITGALSAATGGDGGLASGYALYYDCSRSLSGKEAKDIFGQLKVSELAFLGDDAGDVDTWQEVLEAVLKYLDLHIVQYGKVFYIFSWESVRKGSVSWTLIAGDAAAMQQPTQPFGSSGVTVELTKDTVEDTGAQIDVQEIYNRIELKVSPKTEDAFVTSPVDGDGVTAISNTRKQVYCVEISSDGEGDKAHNAFKQYVVEGTSNGYDGLTVKDWYVRLYRSQNWLFGSGSGGVCEDWTKSVLTGSMTQERCISQLSEKIGCLLLECGARDTKANLKDNSPTPSVGTEKWLVVSVNGNGKDDESTRYPKGSDLQQVWPVAVFTGGTAGGVYSPADDGTVNYLVISGTIVLNPLMSTSGDLADGSESLTMGAMRERLKSKNMSQPIADGKTWPTTVPSRTNGDGRLLMLDWYKGASSNITSLTADNKNRHGVIEDLSPLGGTSYSKGWVPYTGDGEQLYPYKMNSDGSGDDKMNKVDVLVCMLVIGDKVLVEDVSKDGVVGKKANNFTDSAFSWQTYKTLEECGGDIDTYMQQTFTIGYDPKIGSDEYVIGKEHDIGTNFGIEYDTNISAEKGMAIPMPYSAHLSGAVKFSIIGPADETWTDTVKRHKTWFRHSKLTSETCALLSHVSSIIIKSFEMKMYSDSETEDVDSSDIIYASKTDETFYNTKDDLEMKIHSGFTTSEIQEFGLTDATALTTVIDGTSESAVLSIEDVAGGREGKPERLYVDACYGELHRPRVILTQNVQWKDGAVNTFGLYRHAALGRTFYVRDMGTNLMEGSAQLTLEETT